MKNTSEMLTVSTETTRDIVAGATVLMDEVIAAMRRRAAQLSEQRERRRAAMPPPVAGLLHGFARALADKVDAISTRLPDDIRERLRVIVPGFVRATLANDSDVVQLFAMLLAAESDEAARWLVEQVDLLEQRFAS